MTSPTAPGDVSLDDIDSALDEMTEDDSPASTDPTPVDAGATPPAMDQEPADQPPELGEPEADAPVDASAADPAAPADPTETPNPTSGTPQGTPFAFRVDGREVTPEGALQLPDGSVLFPAKAWNQVQGQFLGDRGVWRQKEARYQQAVQQAEQSAQQQVAEQVGAVTLERDQAQAALDEFRGILARGPEAVLEWAQNFEVNRPALEATMRARALEVKLQQAEKQQQTWQSQRTEQEDQQYAESVLRPALESHVDYALDKLLAGEFTGVAPTPEDRAELRQHVWEVAGHQLFHPLVENARKPEDFGFNVALVKQILTREKARVGKVAQQTATLSAAATRNAAALAPTPKTMRPAGATPAKKKPVDVDQMVDAMLDSALSGDDD